MASTDDMLELKAALSAACQSKDASLDVDDESTITRPALDSTPLFEALQNCEWQQALDLCTLTSLSTWVQSSGNSVSTYVIWKRLPIHEAARRQAPAWLLVKMLQLYPQSSSQTTQFGELPLHVAVETGSTPEVIHLLLVSYIEGVAVRDNSGRTPLLICRENEYPDPVVLESLERATRNHELLLEHHATKLQLLTREKNNEIQKLCDKHVSDLDRELQTQCELQTELEGAKQRVKNMSMLSLESQRLAERKETQATNYKLELDTMRHEMEQLTAISNSQQKELEQLYETCEQKDTVIQQLHDHVTTLETDLQNCLVFSRSTIADAMQTHNEHLLLLTSSQEALYGHLFGQVKGMEMLLEKRSIHIPERIPMEILEIIPEVDTSTAIQVATKAATKALEVSNAKSGYV
jgi:hypothetical protein